MQTLIDFAVPAIAFILLVAVGLDLTAADFAHVRRRPAVILAGLLAPLLLLPLIAIGIISAFRPAADVAGGLLLLASCPIGGISNVFSYLARASTALSVTLTGLSCLCAIVTIPLVSKGLELALAQPQGLTAPAAVLVSQLVWLMTAPLALGVWARQRTPALAQRYRPLLQRLSFLGVGGLIVVMILDDPSAFLTGLPTTTPLAAAFVVSCAGAGWLTSMLVTRDSRDRFTLAAEFGTRNVGVAMAIAVTVLGRVEFARFGLTYFMTEVPLMLAAVALYRRTQQSGGDSREAAG
jgi:BASS family bile acid:Na+ symporter